MITKQDMIDLHEELVQVYNSEYNKTLTEKFNISKDNKIETEVLSDILLDFSRGLAIAEAIDAVDRFLKEDPLYLDNLLDNYPEEVEAYCEVHCKLLGKDFNEFKRKNFRLIGDS